MSSDRACLLAAVLLVSGMPYGCSKSDEPIVTREIKMAEFESIRARGAFSLDVSLGPVQKVTMTGTAEDLDQVKTEHEKGRRLLVEAPRGVGDEATLKVTVVLPKLKAFYIGEQLSVSLRSLEQKAILLDVSGTSSVKVAGTVEYAQIDCTGMSSIDASMLSTQRVEAETSGNCAMDVRVSDLLTVDLHGKSTVGYYGSPKSVKKTSDAGGTVVHRGP